MTQEIPVGRADAVVRKGGLRLIAACVGVGVLGAALLFSLVGAADLAGAVLSVLNRLRGFGPLGWLAFIGLQTLVALVGFLPASLLGIAAGAVYGVKLGFGLASVGLLVGAEISFVLTRSGFRKTLVDLLKNRRTFDRLDAALIQGGWYFVLLLRASPVMPFSLTSFALGLSGISQRSYALGTLGSLPALLLYVILGSLGVKSVASVHENTGALHLVLLGVGMITTILLTISGGRLITRAFRASQGNKVKGYFL
jgi:uncharacterized membrane protein YdjX (TVP38/TMEM64 family)